MSIADMLSASIIQAGPKPRDDELDLFGMTHQGKVRKENQDHFLLGMVHQQVQIFGTSLPNPDHLPLKSERLATVLLVADGVGSGAGGEASQLAVETIVKYVSTAMNCYHTRGRAAEKEFYEALKAAALQAHEAVRTEGATRASQDAKPHQKGMATTMTLSLVVWPWAYVLQVGDSRCYHYQEGHLKQVTRDQTLAQDLVDRGALPADRAAQSPLSHVLASAIGASHATPVVSRLDIHKRGCVVLLCSDGLTKHVSDDEIAQHCRDMTSSEQLVRSLVELALERGGSDNVTVVVGRARK